MTEKLDYSHHYKKWHSDDPAHVKSMQDYYTRLMRPHIESVVRRRVLDVGCGTGFALLALRGFGFERVEGLEIDAAQADASRRRGFDVTLVEDSVAFLRDRTGQYDLITAFDVVEHIPVSAQLAFGRAIRTALSPQGMFLCTVPNANSSMAGRWRYIDWTHECSFTETSLDFLLHSCGFRGITITETPHWERPPNIWMPRSAARHWWRYRFFRWLRRQEMIGELGPVEGRRVPLSLNLLGIAHRE